MSAEVVFDNTFFDDIFIRMVALPVVSFRRNTLLDYSLLYRAVSPAFL